MTAVLTLDHLAISASTLQAGVEVVENALGVQMHAGGDHVLMGTHNRLLGLGPHYLEVIAINPEAPSPGFPRWFDLDRFAGAPRLTNWIARTDDLMTALADAPEGAGRPVTLTRGDLRWQMAVPDDGCLPYDGAFPALISWQGTAHPKDRLPDSGLRVKRLEVCHPRAEELSRRIKVQDANVSVSFHLAKAVKLRAELMTPTGECLWLE